MRGYNTSKSQKSNMSAPSFVLAASEVLQMQPERLRLAKKAASIDSHTDTASIHDSCDVGHLVPTHVFRTVLNHPAADTMYDTTQNISREAEAGTEEEEEEEEEIDARADAALRAAGYSRLASWRSSDRERLLALSFLVVQRQHWRRTRVSASACASTRSSTSNKGSSTHLSGPASSPDRVLMRYHRLQNSVRVCVYVSLSLPITQTLTYSSPPTLSHSQVHHLEHLQNSRASLDRAIQASAQRLGGILGAVTSQEQGLEQGQGQPPPAHTHTGAITGSAMSPPYPTV